MKKLNTLDSFISDGFKIERDGQIITLTNEEVKEFNDLQDAYDGRLSINMLKEDLIFEGDALQPTMKILAQIEQDEAACINITHEFYRKVFKESYDIEMETVRLEAQNYFEKHLTKQQLQELREKYAPGTRIRCVKMYDPYHPIEGGMCGTVSKVDDAGYIRMIWDNGSILALCPIYDNFKIIENNCTTGGEKQ